MPVAHTSHWLINVAYAFPAVGIGGWIAFTALLDRHRKQHEISDEEESE